MAMAVLMSGSDTPEKHGKPWSDREVRLLRELYPTCSPSEVASTLKRTERAVINKAYREDISPTHLFSDDELSVIRRWYQEREGKPLDLDGLADKLDRAKTTICAKAHDLGLTNQRRLSAAGKETTDDGRYYVRDDDGRVLDTRKHPTPEAGKKASGEHLMEWREENGHPKGMLGKSHTEETRRRMSEAKQEWNDALTDEEKTRQALKAVETRIEKYGTAGPINVTNPYSRTRSGKREDLDGQFFRSSWEANYARYLNLLEEQGEIDRWEYEAKEFWFEGIKRGTRSYTPDFRVEFSDGLVEFHEVKGWMDQKSRTKLDRMERYHPEVELVLIGEEAYYEIRDNLAGAIEGWETNDT